MRSVCNVTTILPQNLFKKCTFATSLRHRSSEIGGNNWTINTLRSTYAAGFITNSLSFKKSTFKVAGTIPEMWEVITSTLVTWVITLSSGFPRRKSRTALCLAGLYSTSTAVYFLVFQLQEFVAWSCRLFASQGPGKCAIVPRGLEANCWSHWIHSAVEIVQEVCNDAIFFYKMWKLKET